MDWASRYFEDIGERADYQTLVLRSGEWLEVLLGERIAGTSMRALVVALHVGCGGSPSEIEQRIDRDGWRAGLEESHGVADWPSISILAEQLYAFAIDGVVTDTRLPDDVEARRSHLEALFARAARLMELLPPNWEPNPRHPWSLSGTYASALARWKMDREAPITTAEIARLGRLDDKTVLNALGRQLHPDAKGLIAADEARGWLMGRRPRKFRPSRWLNASDDQDSRSPDRTDNEPDIVMVPVDAHGASFLPTLARQTRGTGSERLGFRIGAKGDEFVVHDYFEALDALKGMHPPRWRRPNAEGNWGIVRGEPNWRTVPRVEIDRLLHEAGFMATPSAQA
ncbi:hypothetical protein [Falsiroseomonas sp.]|uniref:hypothetical protein n=1 Tax=Falsiroseomonas sp. TaxID=2870721 RepID=UPI003F729C66